jgi:hypothetical protein
MLAASAAVQQGGQHLRGGGLLIQRFGLFKRRGQGSGPLTRPGVSVGA